MALVIRPLNTEDYAALAACNQAAMPGTEDTAESLQEDDARTLAFARWVAEADGQIAGHASWFQFRNRLHPQKFWMDGAVHPSFGGRGIGSALLSKVLEEIGAKNAMSLRTATREDFAAGFRFLTKRGFVEAKRTWVQSLDLDALDFGPYAGLPEQVEAQGIRLCRLSSLMGVPGWEARLLDLYNAIQADVPDIDPAKAVDMAHFRNKYLTSSTFLADGHFIAVDGDRWVGLSTLWSESHSSQMETGLTGVLPEYRHRRIALALKLRSLAWAQAQGVTRIHTSNASTNTGIVAINERLGFVKEPAWIHLIRQF